MKNYFVHVMALPWLIFGFSFSQNLSISIEIEKQIFTEGEPVALYLTVLNISTEEISYYSPHLKGGNLFFVLQDENKDTIHYRGSYASHITVIQILGIDRSAQYLNYVESNYPNIYESTIPIPVPIASRLKPGKYNVTAHFINRNDTISSSTIYFSIVPPLGDDIQVFEILKKRFTLDFLWNKNQDSVITVFSDLLKNFPKSVYAPRFQWGLFAAYFKKGDTVQANTFLTNIIDANQDNSFGIEAFKWLKISDDMKKEYYEKLKRLNPNSRLIKFNALMPKNK